MIDETHVLTVAHVIGSVSTISVQASDDAGGNAIVSSAVLIGRDDQHDLALLQLTKGHTMAAQGRGIPFAPTRAPVGTTITEYGYPEGTPRTAESGRITAIKQHPQVQTSPNETVEPSGGLLESSASIDPGDSGGPVVNDIGQIVGLNESSLSGSAQRNYAVPTTSSRFRSQMQSWLDARQAQSLDCGLTTQERALVHSTHPDAVALWRTLGKYLAAVDLGDQTASGISSTQTGYQVAYGTLANPMKGNFRSFTEFRAQMSTQLFGLPDIVKGSMTTTEYGKDVFTATWVTATRGPNNRPIGVCTQHTVKVSSRDDRTGQWQLTKFFDARQTPIGPHPGTSSSSAPMSASPPPTRQPTPTEPGPTAAPTTSQSNASDTCG